MIKITRAEASNFYKLLSRNQKHEMIKRLGFSNSSALTAHLNNKKYANTVLAPDKLLSLNNMLVEWNVDIDDYRYEHLDFASVERAIQKCETGLQLFDIEDQLDLLLVAVNVKKEELKEKESR